LQGSVLLQVNTSSRIQTETISLEGIPGGVLFATPVSSSPSLLASLPTDKFNPVALPSIWVSLFQTPPADRDDDGISGAADAVQILSLQSGQQLKLENFAGVTLVNATVEGVQTGVKWKIRNGDGRQFFIEKTKDVNGNDILVIRGEQRTYELAPV